MPHPIEDYLDECLRLLWRFSDRALMECHRWAPVPGPRWRESYQHLIQYSQDSDFLLRVLGAR
jgi:hypothetical protein